MRLYVELSIGLTACDAHSFQFSMILETLRHLETKNLHNRSETKPSFQIVYFNGIFLTLLT